jgi:hypothetical protein
MPRLLLALAANDSSSVPRVFRLGLLLASILVALLVTGTIGPKDPAAYLIGIPAAWFLFAPIRRLLYDED